MLIRIQQAIYKKPVNLLETNYGERKKKEREREKERKEGRRKEKGEQRKESLKPIQAKYTLSKSLGSRCIWDSELL